MSLLTGMNSMFENKAAMEAAEDELLFDEEIAMEADELIDELVDGNSPFEDADIDGMVDEDFDNDELDDEVNAEECGNLTGQGYAAEAAALTGTAFLQSLVRDTNDPIKTKPGSIGQQSSAASFANNYSDEYEDDNDPITTKPGSVGQQSSSANHKDNFSDEKQNVESRDPRRSGSIGQKNSVAKDPAMESFSFLSNLVRGSEPAIENSFAPNPTFQESGRYVNDATILGIETLNRIAVENMIQKGQSQAALDYLSEYYNMVQEAAAGVDLNDKTDTMSIAANSLSIGIESMIMWVQAKKMEANAIESGKDALEATRSVVNIMKNKSNMMKQNGELTPVTEAAIDNTIKFMTLAMESGGCCDPEATEDGSIGQETSKAHSGENFSGGILDSHDPVQTRDGSEGQQDSAATFNENHSGGILDSMDPVQTGDGSVGQQDSTAKDPAAEALTALEKLEELTRSLEDDDE